MRRISVSLSMKNERNTYLAAVSIALITASVLLATYYVVLRPEPERYTTIYLLDSSKKGTNYPEYLVSNVNSTFSVFVDVENHMGRTLNNTEVRVKVTENLNSTFPVKADALQTFNGTISDGATWENIATISLKQPGDYSVVFELWIPNKETGILEFSGNFCLLNIQVAPENAS